MTLRWMVEREENGRQVVIVYPENTTKNEINREHRGKGVMKRKLIKVKRRK